MKTRIIEGRLWKHNEKGLNKNLSGRGLPGIDTLMSVRFHNEENIHQVMY